MARALQNCSSKKLKRLSECLSLVMLKAISNLKGMKQIKAFYNSFYSNNTKSLFIMLQAITSLKDNFAKRSFLGVIQNLSKQLLNRKFVKGGL